MERLQSFVIFPFIVRAGLTEPILPLQTISHHYNNRDVIRALENLIYSFVDSKCLSKIESVPESVHVFNKRYIQDCVYKILSRALLVHVIHDF